MFTIVYRTATRLTPTHTRTAATSASPKRSAWASRRTPSPVKPTATTPTPTPTTPAATQVGSSTLASPSSTEESNLEDDSSLPLPEIPSTRTPLPSSSSSPQAHSTTYPSTTTSFTSTPIIPPPKPFELPKEQREIDWSTSYHGLSAQPFSQKAADTLMRPLVASEIEIKPDGLLYLPEILYRRILNQAFGPGGWGMVPRGEMTVVKMLVSREWGLVAGGRLVSVARGEQTFFDPSGLPTATEGCKSNALMRCCKDLGIASELWDPGFIRTFKTQHCVEAWTEHVVSKKKQKRWRKKGNKFEYPYQEAK